MRTWLRRLALAVVTGYIFIYFSELAFWARPLEGTTLPGALALLLPYSFAAYAFLVLVSTFRVRSLAAVFLAGALFGWLIEGVFVQTAYEQLPFSISFTGLAWHALLTVLAGWWALQWALRTGVWRALWVSTLVGTVYGLWATSWWSEAPPPPLPDVSYGFRVGRRRWWVGPHPLSPSALWAAAASPRSRAAPCAWSALARLPRKERGSQTPAMRGGV